MSRTVGACVKLAEGFGMILRSNFAEATSEINGGLHLLCESMHASNEQVLGNLMLVLGYLFEKYDDVTRDVFELVHNAWTLCQGDPVNAVCAARA
jgi:hypothetical protein